MWTFTNKEIKKILEDITRNINWQWYGTYNSKLLGEWIEKVDNKIYSYWDSANRINRKLTAKTDKIIIDKHIRESSLNFFLYFDVNYNRNWWKNEPFINTTCQILQELNKTLQNTSYNSENYFLWPKWIQKSYFKVKDYSLLSKELLKATKTSDPKFFSWLNMFLKKISDKTENIILIFTDRFWFDEQNINLINYLQSKNMIHFFVLNIYQEWENYHNFDIIFPKMPKWTSYTLI